MQVNYKYPLKVDRRQMVEMPLGAIILSAQFQGNNLCLWARVDTDKPPVNRIIHIYGTGHEMESHIHRYIGTAQMPHDILVFHVFEEQ